MINESFFNKESGFYFDRFAESKAFIKVYSPEGWTPLFCQVSEKKQAKQVAQLLNDSTYFNTYVPFPTVAKSNPNFSTGYWRGTVW
ncbi:MAG TPA: glycoside hydrolase, partial [Bacteroidales bacterium]|nr:glycoside hydrolase [Bacteroidales bacterium]